jgi:hypothetical protein
MHRQADKPFTVSEYNHPVPSEYAAETVPMIFTISAAEQTVWYEVVSK